MTAPARASWSEAVRAQALRLREQAGRLREAAAAVTLPGAEGAAVRRRITGQADRAETAAAALEHAADDLLAHEAVLAALARRRREGGAARNIG